MRTPTRGRTLVDVCVALGVLAVLFSFGLPSACRVREKGRRPNCKNMQRLLMLACITYRDGQGMARDFPPDDGSDFLIHLYTTEEVSEPGLFICPATTDSNGDGWQLIKGNGRGPINACSYAARRNRHQGSYPGVGPEPHHDAAETPMTSDDDGPGEGDVRFNHDDAVVCSFLDGHVEEMTLTDPRLGGATTIGEGLLDPLAN